MSIKHTFIRKGVIGPLHPQSLWLTVTACRHKKGAAKTFLFCSSHRLVLGSALIHAVQRTTKMAITLPSSILMLSMFTSFYQNMATVPIQCILMLMHDAVLSRSTVVFLLLFHVWSLVLTKNSAALRKHRKSCISVFQVPLRR